MRVIGIDIGGTFTKLGLVEGKRILLKRQFPTPRFPTPMALEEMLLAQIKDLRKRSRIPVQSVGIGIPGLIRYPEGVIRAAANLPGSWRDFPLRQRLTRRLGLGVWVDNDVNLMTLAEWVAGAGKGTSDLVCITLGTGVGGGLILNGRLYRGSWGFAGEIGHMPLGMRGTHCSCGGEACLERTVGNRDILRWLRSQLRKKARSRIWRLIDHRLDRLTPEVVDRACALGDPLAQETWRRVGTHLGLILAGVVNLLNPERIVVGGGIAKAGRWIFHPIQETLRHRAMQGLGDIPVVPAILGTSAGLLGAALLAQGKG